MPAFPPITPLAPLAPRLRLVEPHPWAEGVLPPVRLELGALPSPSTYALSSYWEERPAGGAVQRHGIEKNFQLSTQPLPSGGWVLSYAATAPPTLRKPDLTALEKALLLLADLYQRLELQIAPDGQLVAVLNQDEVRQTWERVRAELVSRSGGKDDITQLLLAGVEEQLQQPGSLLASLRYDYQFAFLLKGLYQQRFESNRRYGQALVLPRFFAGIDLWCWEQLEVLPPPAPGRVALRLSGQLDYDRTDAVAVVQQMLASQAAARGQPPAAAWAEVNLRFAYEAVYVVDAATGWPASVEASVRCWLPDLYSKEYFLRLELAA